MTSNSAIMEKEDISTHSLSDKWVLWAHLPHVTDWSNKSYIAIQEISKIEEIVSLYNIIPEPMVKNCMLFLMRKNIFPSWEDPQNRKGGCFSFKVNNKRVSDIWKKLSYALLGETLSKKPSLMNKITGITISPKKAFCIIKIWTSDLSFQNPNDIVNIDGLSTHGCIFKRHKPEY
mgnify:FL=1|jgi:hypothetical protein